MSHPAESPVHSAPVSPQSVNKAAWALYIIVLISGAVLMGIEIAGAKVLAPSFGTSTYVWGSIIGMFMAALAAGYYLGGMLADARPYFGWMAGIVSAAGLWTALLIPRLGPAICEGIGRGDLGPVWGPLLATFAVFYVPSFLMGMVSPYAVKLNASSLAALGGVAGKLYALSTFGSIVGTLLTTFVLVPSFFLSNVLTFLGLLLIVAAIISFLMFRSGTGGLAQVERTSLGVMVLLALICAEAWAVFPVEPYMAPGERLLHYEDSAYHEILVTEDSLFTGERGGGMLMPPKMWTPGAPDLPRGLHEVRRLLKFNENWESGVFPYHEEYLNAVNYTDLLHLPLMWVKDPKRVLVVGGGGGIIPSQYNQWYGSEVDVAEIDPAVERVARKYFQVPNTPNIRFHIGDGRQTVRKFPDKTFDIIFLDAYSSGGQIPFHLLTWEFLQNVRSKLTDRGVLVTNIISAVRNGSEARIPPAALFLAEYKTLSAGEAQAKHKKDGDQTPLFGQLYVFPKVYESQPLAGAAYEDYRNVIVVATREEQPLSHDSMVEKMTALTNPDKPVIRCKNMLWHVNHIYEKKWGPKPEELSSVSILSDDYAPVDTMYRPVKRDESMRHLWLGY
ncbi:MAG TPA: fused MFS/spermidine synthase [Planctomycetota bacterium]